MCNGLQPHVYLVLVKHAYEENYSLVTEYYNFFPKMLRLRCQFVSLAEKYMFLVLTCLYIFNEKILLNLHHKYMFNRPGVAGDVLQSPLLLIHSLTD